jgi:pyruvate kinase
VIDAAHPERHTALPDAICCALRRIAVLLPITAAVIYTSSGFTSLRAARERSAGADPQHKPNQSVARRIALVWGVHSVLIGEIASIDEVVERACLAALTKGSRQMAMSSPLLLGPHLA